MKIHDTCSSAELKPLSDCVVGIRKQKKTLQYCHVLLNRIHLLNLLEFCNRALNLKLIVYSMS